MKPTSIPEGPTPGGSINYDLREASESDESFLREMLYLALYVPPGETPLPRSVLDNPAIVRYVEGWESARKIVDGSGSQTESRWGPRGFAVSLLRTLDMDLSARIFPN